MPKSKRSSWGCVQRMDRDRYRIRYWADLGDGYRRHTLTVRGTRREAEARLAELRTKHERAPGEQVRRPTRRTVGWYYENAWLPKAEKSERRRTLANKLSTWRRHVRPVWGEVPVASLRRSDVQAWLLDDGSGLTHSSAKRSVCLLRELMAAAVRYGDIERDPLDGSMDLPDASRKADRTVLRGEGQFRAYADAVRGTPVEAPFILMAIGGCRVGESLSPLASEVYTVEIDGVSLVCVRIDRDVDDRGEMDDLKTPQSKRTVAVAGEYGERLLAVRDECEAQGLDYLADDGTGRPLSTATLRRQWYRLVESAGLPRRLMRNLRTSFATSMLWDKDVPLDKLQPMMGHKPGSPVTLASYDRPADDDVLRYRARAEVPGTWDKLGHGRVMQSP